MAKAKTPGPIGFDSGGGNVTVQLTKRTMRMYNLTKNELRTFSLLNNLRVGFASFGTLFLGVALPDAYLWFFDTTGATDWRKPLFFIACALAWVLLALWPRHEQQRLLQQIESETEHPEDKQTGVQTPTWSLTK